MGGRVVHGVACVVAWVCGACGACGACVACVACGCLGVRCVRCVRCVRGVWLLGRAVRAWVCVACVACGTLLGLAVGACVHVLLTDRMLGGGGEGDGDVRRAGAHLDGGGRGVLLVKPKVDGQLSRTHAQRG
eukprot:5450410-Prymnesium_polylepis.1